MAIFRDTEAQLTAMESCAHLPADERVKWRPWPRENRRKTSELGQSRAKTGAPNFDL